jgi:hypothetical protein
MSARLAPGESICPVDSHLFVRPSPERRPHKYWRLVVRYRIDFPICEASGVLNEEFWQMADPLFQRDAQELRCGEHLHKHQIVICSVLDVARRDDRNKAHVLAWKSIIRAFSTGALPCRIELPYEAAELPGEAPVITGNAAGSPQSKPLTIRSGHGPFGKPKVMKNTFRLATALQGSAALLFVIPRACDFFDPFAFLYPTRYFQSPRKRRHPERSASQIYRITQGFMERSRRTPAMFVGRCSSELSGRRLQGKSKSHRLRAEPRDLQFRGPLLGMFFDGASRRICTD